MKMAAAAFVACGLVVVSASAQQQQQGQQQAVGAAAVRTRENAQVIQLDQHQTPVIAVLYGQQQQGDTQIIAMVSSPDQPQLDKEILFNRENANKRTVVHEGEQAGQARRITLVARRGQEDAQIEKIAENQGIMVYGVRKPAPKQQQAQQPQQDQAQGAQAQAGGGAQTGAAQPAAAQQDPAAAAQQAAEKQKAAEAEAKRKAAEPKPDVYDAIITVYVTTGR
jgi:hypothetical protein